MVANDGRFPDVIVARVVERCENGESAAEVSAWLVDLGYSATAEEVAAIAGRHRQERRKGPPRDRARPRC